MNLITAKQLHIITDSSSTLFCLFIHMWTKSLKCIQIVERACYLKERHTYFCYKYRKHFYNSIAHGICVSVVMSELPWARKVSAAVSVGPRLTRSPAARRARSTSNRAAEHSPVRWPSPAGHSRVRRQRSRRASWSTAAARARCSLHFAGSGRCSARAARDTPLHTVAAELPTTTTPPPAPRALRARRVTIVFQSPPQVSTTRST